MAKILIVDQSLVVLKVAARQFEAEHHSVVGWTSALDLAFRTSQLRPDVILLAVELPELDGPTFFPEVRKESVVLLHSAHSDEQLEEYVRKWKASGFLGKAWPWSRKLASVKGYLANSKSDQGEHGSTPC